MKPIIIFVDDAPQPAGGQHSLLSLLLTFTARKANGEGAGIRVYCTSQHTLQFYQQGLEGMGLLDVVHLKTPFGIVLETLRRPNRGSFLYHLNTWRAVASMGFFFSLRGVPFVVRVRTKPPKRLRFLWGRAIKKAKRLIHNSRFIRGAVESEVGPEGLRQDVIYNYHGLKECEVQRIADARFAKIEDRFVVNCVARVSRRKNQIFLIEALQAWLDSARPSENVEINFFGECSTRAEEKEYVQRFLDTLSGLDLGGNVRLTFPGKVVAKDLAFSCAVLAVPHFEEPLGRTLMEATAIGVPVIAMAEGGNPEVVRTEDPCNFLLDRDLQEWVGAINSLYSRWVKERRMAPSLGLRSEFSLENTAKREWSLLLGEVEASGHSSQGSRSNPPTVD